MTDAFIEGLSASDKRKVNVLFRKIADHGQIHNREQFKKVKEKIFEFKRFQIRIGCFQVETIWYLTHGFIKKQMIGHAELHRAFRLMNEHLAWINRQ